MLPEAGCRQIAVMAVAWDPVDCGSAASICWRLNSWDLPAHHGVRRKLRRSRWPRASWWDPETLPCWTTIGSLSVVNSIFFARSSLHGCDECPAFFHEVLHVGDMAYDFHSDNGRRGAVFSAFSKASPKFQGRSILGASFSIPEIGIRNSNSATFARNGDAWMRDIEPLAAYVPPLGPWRSMISCR